MYSKGKRILSYGGKSEYRRDMRRVCMYVCVYVCVCVSVGSWVWFMGVCASHACRRNEKRWAFKIYVPAERKSLAKNKGYMCSSLAALHVALTRPRLSPSLADTPCTILIMVLL